MFAAVDDETYACYCDGCLGYVGRDDNLASSVRRGLEDALLGGLRESSEERQREDLLVS